jgi:hypothetical protein
MRCPRGHSCSNPIHATGNSGPPLGFADPLLGFADPLLGLGFADPLLGFADPLLGLGFAAEDDPPAGRSPATGMLLFKFGFVRSLIFGFTASPPTG